MKKVYLHRSVALASLCLVTAVSSPSLAQVEVKSSLSVPGQTEAKLPLSAVSGPEQTTTASAAHQAAVRLCQHLKGLSRQQVLDLLGPPAPILLPGNYNISEGPSFPRSTVELAESLIDTREDTFAFNFLDSPVLIRLRFQNDLCTAATPLPAEQALPPKEPPILPNSVFPGDVLISFGKRKTYSFPKSLGYRGRHNLADIKVILAAAENMAGDISKDILLNLLAVHSKDLPAADAQHLQSILDGLDALPRSLICLLWLRNCKVHLAPNVTDIVHRRKNSHPHGYEKGAVWDSVPALYNYKNNWIVIGQSFLSQNKFLPNSSYENLVQHEAGHAIDRYLHYPSDSDQFIACYVKDCKNISSNNKAARKYYLQHGYHGRSETFAELVCCLYGYSDYSELESMPRCFPACYAFLKQILPAPSQAKQDWDAIMISGADALAHENYDQAASNYAAALKASQKLGQDKPLSISLSYMGYTCWLQCRYADAEKYYRQALAIAENGNDIDETFLADLLSYLADVSLELGRYEEVEPLCKRALVVYERIEGASGEAQAATLSRLAGLYLTRGKLAEAEKLYRRSLSTYEKTAGPESESVARILTGLAACRREQGMYPDAESLIRRAIAIRQKAQGPLRSELAADLVELGIIYSCQGRYREAEVVDRRALATAEAFGPEYPDLASSLDTLGQLLTTQGKYEQAEPLLARSLRIYERTLGPHHAFVANVLINTAWLHA